MSAPTPTLWQFRHSHFNEKARWALDWKGIRHVRRSLLPGFHIPRVLWMTGQKSLPVLRLDGRVIADSTRIIAALEALRPDPPLYPADPAALRHALALEEFFDEELGPYIRRSFFHDLLPHTDYAAALTATDFPPLVRHAYRALFPAIRIVMRMDMRIDEPGAALGRAKVVAALDRIETELQPSGFLVGDRFSVADLTAAALLSPLLTPSEYPYAFPGPIPEPVASFRASLAGRRAFAWASDMYHRYRGRSVEIAT
ncbi:MAG: glutathione S-transferase [Deltaproteobacteria bacterium]|nr:glutathione S-transferase [Deltaproteobacteria bacterium]